MVTLHGAEGYMGVMAGHMPLISTLKPGILEVKGGTNGDARYFVSAGFAEVNPAKLTVLAEEALPMSELDAATLDQRIKNAGEDVMLAKTDDERARAVEAVDELKMLRAAL